MLNGVPSLLQTSAQVHQGNSGGLLLNERGEFLGMITSNARHTENEKSILIPSLNFSIPIHLMNGPIRNFLQDGKSKHLNEFNKPNRNLRNLWEFRDQDLIGKDSKFLKFLDKIENMEFQKSNNISKL
jgi:peroxisomal leader peptide-processing protease